MKYISLILIVATTCIAHSLFGQAHFDSNSILGKWKIDIMRDSAGNALDITPPTNNEVPEVLHFLTIKRKSISFEYLDTKLKGSWHLQNDSLVISAKNKFAITYPIAELTKDTLVLKHNLEMIDDKVMTIRIFYTNNH